MTEKLGQKYNPFDEIIKILEEGYKKNAPNQLELKVAEAPIVKEEKEGIKGFFIKIMGYLMDGKSISHRVSSRNLVSYGYISPEALKIVTDSLKDD